MSDMPLTDDQSIFTEPELLRVAWERGLLQHLLRDYQVQLFDDLWSAIENKECLKFVLNCSRRWGKSTLLCLIAIMYSIKYPGSQIRFAAPTAKALRKITNPIIKMLLASCPQDLKPLYKTQDGVWVFPNGSEIHLAGTDNNNSESLRGTASHLNLIDEAGFCDELEYVVQSILIPQTLTTGGTTLLASTPPKTPAHDFSSIAQECEAEGHYKKYTIYDNESISNEEINLFAKESGGFSSTTWKREYMAEFVVDEDSQIIPEWSDDYITEHKVDSLTPFWHRYVGMDLGVRDFTAVLYAHYNFSDATLYIEDETTIAGEKVTTENLTKELKEKEKLIFGDLKPYRRVSDNNNLMLLNDLHSAHGMHFLPTGKDSLDAMVNAVRMMAQKGQIKVHPRCTMLIGCLKYGIWTQKRDKFGRAKVYKHFDHLAALVYLVRNLSRNTNPVPNTHNMSQYTHFIPEGMNQTRTQEAFKNLFRRKK